MKMVCRGEFDDDALHRTKQLFWDNCDRIPHSVMEDLGWVLCPSHYKEYSSSSTILSPMCLSLPRTGVHNAVDLAGITWYYLLITFTLTLRQCATKVILFMLSQPYYVQIGLFVCSFHLFVRPDRSCYHDVSWSAWAVSM